MGPAIILDKSALQALSQKELLFLFKYYYLVIPPILILEILGDIQKGDDISQSKQQVIYLANKFHPQSASLNASHHNLIRAELEGAPITMDYRPIVYAEPMETPDGKIGAIIKPSPAEEAIERWREGDFRSDEELHSRIWREATTGFDLAGLTERVRPILGSTPKTDSPNELVMILDDFLLNIANGMELLHWVGGIVDLDKEMIKRALERYNAGGFTALEQFAPYTAYCLRVSLLFFLGLVNEIITPRPTNILDLEYLYYIPFCVAVSSGDRLHKILCPLIIDDRQEFIEIERLKSDLADMSAVWLSLDEETRKEEWEQKYGYTPPQNADSPTYQLWEKSKHWHLKDDLTPQEAVSSSPSIEPDFIEVRRNISANAPCPCGSGKKFKDCHLEEVKAKKSK